MNLAPKSGRKPKAMGVPLFSMVLELKSEKTSYTHMFYQYILGCAEIWV